MSKRAALGKGLEALFGKVENETLEDNGKDLSEEVMLETLIPNPYQPRKLFEPEKMKELVDSIKEHGVIQPLIVRKKDNIYEIVAGERRWRAAKLAGLNKVPVVLREYDDEQMMEVAMIENIQRHDLNPLEEAAGIKSMMEKLKLTQAEVAKKLGRSRTAVTNILRVMNLPEFVRNCLSKDELNLGQVRPLLGLEDEEEQIALAKIIIEQGLSVRKVEEVINEIKAGKKVAEIFAEEDTQKPDKSIGQVKKREIVDVNNEIFYKEYQEKIMSTLGTKVKIHRKTETSGSIQIDYYNIEDLERIFEVIEKRKPVIKKQIGVATKLTV